MKLFQNYNFRILVTWLVWIQCGSVFAGDLHGDGVPQYRAYLKSLDNSKYEYEIDGYNEMPGGKRNIKGKDSLTFSYPKIKITRQRTYDASPIAVEEFVYDGAMMQALTSSRILFIGKNPETFKMRFDYENPLLLPVSFAFYRKESNSMWNELFEDSAWKYFSENVSHVKSENGLKEKAVFAGKTPISGEKTECIIEGGGDFQLPKKWSYSSGNLKGDVEILSWTTGNANFPLPNEMVKTVYLNGKVLSFRRYRLKSFQKISPDQFSGDTFRINSESARGVVDCDDNVSFPVSE